MSDSAAGRPLPVIPDDEPLYHIELSRRKIEGARVAIVPGAPERTALIASRLESPVRLAHHRGLEGWLGRLAGVPVLVQTSGMGGPSLEIVMQELLLLGVRHFLRIGTTGAIQASVPVGALVVSEGAVRIDGTSDHYAPPGYPAVADLMLTGHLVAAARASGRPFAHGITASSASFFAGQERYDSGVAYVPRHFRGSLDEWRNLGVLNYEMEAATLFVLARLAGARAGCLCAVVANRAGSERVHRDAIEQATDAAVTVGLAGLAAHIRDPLSGLTG